MTLTGLFCLQVRHFRLEVDSFPKKDVARRARRKGSELRFILSLAPQDSTRDLRCCRSPLRDMAQNAECEL